MSQDNPLVVSPAPHVKKDNSIERVMFLVILALMFPTAGAIYFFGLYVLLMLITSIVTCVLTEFIAKMLRKREFVLDGSAIITAILLVLILPPRAPLWVVVIGGVFAIAIVKEAFGGLGHNIFNPALAGRAFLAISLPIIMTSWISPTKSLTSDGVTSATPLGESFVRESTKTDLYKDLFFGNVAGSAGETSVLLILIGAAILLAFGIIKWEIPTFYIGTVFLLALALGKDPIFHLLAGGLVFGAFFMATDYVTRPLTQSGQIIFAVGAGILTVLIRLYGNMPEGVCFSILLMNCFTPLIDRYTKTKPYGVTLKEYMEETVK